MKDVGTFAYVHVAGNPCNEGMYKKGVRSVASMAGNPSDAD